MSREGNFTCPVETFMLFLSDMYIEISDPRFSLFHDLLTEEDFKNSLLSESYLEIESEFRDEK